MNIQPYPEEEAKYRKFLSQGLLVDIVLKQDQKTMTLTRGRIKDLLTSKDFHPRGIKVRLQEKGIERLYFTSLYSKQKDIHYNGENKDEDYIGRVQRVYFPNNLGILILNQEGNQISNGFFNLFSSIYIENIFIIINKLLLIDRQIIETLRKVNNRYIDIILNEDSLVIFNNIFNEQLIEHLNTTFNKTIRYFLYKENKLYRFKL